MFLSSSFINWLFRIWQRKRKTRRLKRICFKVVRLLSAFFRKQTKPLIATFLTKRWRSS